MRSDINPCPCGKNAHMSEWQNGDNLRYEVLCNDDNCRLGYLHTVGSFGTEQEAIDAWNAIAKRTCKPIDEYSCGVPSCGNCGVTLNMVTSGVRPFSKVLPNYCHNCGARVEGD